MRRVLARKSAHKGGEGEENRSRGRVWQDPLLQCTFSCATSMLQAPESEASAIRAHCRAGCGDRDGRGCSTGWVRTGCA